MIWLGGLQSVLLIYLPTVIVAATLGVWLFYVQHQFEETHWAQAETWQLHHAALAGSSHYVLPRPLRWLSANIGIHHVHHLYSRIPFYRLPEILRDHADLAVAQRLTLAREPAIGEPASVGRQAETPGLVQRGPSALQRRVVVVGQREWCIVGGRLSCRRGQKVDVKFPK